VKVVITISNNEINYLNDLLRLLFSWYFPKIYYFVYVFSSNLIVEKTARSSEENHLYTEINEESKNEKEKYMSQKNENPLYKTAVGDAVFNPIYDRFDCFCLFVCLFVCCTFVSFLGLVVPSFLLSFSFLVFFINSQS